MAYTVSALASNVVGNQRKISARLTADAATGSWETGLQNITDLSVGLQSASTASIKFAMNEGVSGTSIVGTVGISGAASGDELIVTVYGY